MRALRQSTAVVIVVGPIADISDATLISDQDVTAIDCGIKKAGTAGAAISLTASGGDNDMTPTANNPGHYDLELTTGNTDTLGPMRMTFNKDDTFIAFWEDFEVITAAEFDRKFSTGASVADVKADTAAILLDTGTDGVVLAADAITAAKIADDAISAEHLATGALTADAFAADAIVAATLATGCLTADAFAANALVAATFAADFLTAAKIADDAFSSEHFATGALTADAFAAASITAAAIATNAIDADALAADALTEIQASCNSALVALALDHLVAVAVTGTDVANDSIIAQMVSKSATADWDTYDNATDSPEAIKDALATAADIGDAVWDEALSGHTGAGSAGAEIITHATPAEVNTQVAAALATYDPPTRAELTTDKESIITQVDANETKIDIIDTNVDTLITRVPAEVAQKAHLVNGSGDITPPTNKGIWDVLNDGSISMSALNTAISNMAANVSAILTDTGTTLDGYIQAILADTAEIQAELADGGRLDLILDELTAQGDTNAGLITTVDTVVDAVLVDTNELQTDWHDGGRLDVIQDGILADTGTDGVIVQEMKASALADFFDVDSTSDYASAVSGSVGKEIADNAGGSLLTVQAIVDGVLDELTADHDGVGSVGEAIAAAGSGADAAAIADAVWDEDITDHTAADSAGAQLGTKVDAILADTGTDGVVLGADAITAAKIADDAFSSEHFATGALTADAFAANAITASAIAADAIGASELAADAVAEIVDAVWDELSTGHTDAGKAGARMWTDIPAILVDTGTTLETHLTDIKGTSFVKDTNSLVNLALASVCTEARLAELAAANLPADIDAILADTNELELDWKNGGRLDLLIDGMPAAVLAATTSEPANLSVKTLNGMIWHLFSRFYHKNTQSATELKTYKADGTTVLATRTTSDVAGLQTVGAGS
jgi:hypothetical protein